MAEGMVNTMWRSSERDSLEQAEDEGVESHAVAGELRVLAHLGVQTMEHAGGRA